MDRNACKNNSTKTSESDLKYNNLNLCFPQVSVALLIKDGV